MKIFEIEKYLKEKYYFWNKNLFMRIAKIKIPLEQTKKVNLKEIDLTKKQLGSCLLYTSRCV